MRATTCVWLSVGLVLAALAAWLLALQRREEEGFQAAAASTSTDPTTTNLLLDYVDKLKRVSRHVSNPSTWVERVRLARLTPAQLARQHLQGLATPAGGP